MNFSFLAYLLAFIFSFSASGSVLEDFDGGRSLSYQGQQDIPYAPEPLPQHSNSEKADQCDSCEWDSDGEFTPRSSASATVGRTELLLAMVPGAPLQGYSQQWRRPPKST